MPSRPSSGRLLHQNGPPHPDSTSTHERKFDEAAAAPAPVPEPGRPRHLPPAPGDRTCTKRSALQRWGSAPPEHRTCQTHVPEPQVHARGLSPPHPPLCPPVNVPKARDSPKLGASPHGAVGEGTLTLPNLLREQAGQRREVNPCDKQRTQRLAGAGSPSGQRGVRARLGSSQSHR